MTGDDIVLRVEELCVAFPDHNGGSPVQAVRGLNLEVHRSETVALVGESGCGKSTTMLAIMGLLPPATRVTGRAHVGGADLLNASTRTMRAIRGARVAMIFQDPMTSLNPLMTVGRQLAEATLVHRPVGRRAARERAVELLDLVAIPQARRRLGNYPHELSGGMRQRVMIAMAIANEPELLIADEPTTALDVTIQAQVLDVLQRLRSDLGLALVLVTHDLGVVAGLADVVHVMYAGAVVEHGNVRDVFHAPNHPYTRALLASSPRMDRDDELVPIEGTAPILRGEVNGCAFADRCTHATTPCRAVTPALRVRGRTTVACDVAPALYGDVT